jgi:hypothetical protein
MFSGDVPVLLTIPATVVTEDLFLSILYTVKKIAPFSYEIFYVLLNCGEKFYQCKSEHRPGTTFVHLVFTAAYFYLRRKPTPNIF